MDATWKKRLALLPLLTLTALAGAEEKLKQPFGMRGVEPRVQLRHAFELDPKAVARPPHADPEVRQASTDPHHPKSQTLLALYAEAERLAGRPRPVSDFTDLIERCRQAQEVLEEQESTGLARLTSWALNRRGELRVAAGEPREAFEDFQQAILLDQQNPAALLNRGVTLAQYGQPEHASRDFCAAIALDPSGQAAYRNRAELRLQQGDFAGATADFSAALEHGQPDATLYTGRGFAQANLGKAALAAKDYTAALRLAPGDCETLVLRGSLYAGVGQYENALTDFTAALESNAESATANRSTAWLLATCPDKRFHDAELALEAARRAQQFGDKNDPLVKEALAAAYAAAGQFEIAERLQQQALDAAPAQLKAEMGQRLGLYREGRGYVQPRVQIARATDTEG
ncbi:MAG: tetratricopeptide repeat protein [Planctomycetales bacterium]|nr:tetratricopeptide repeat protein [Planctomycetales bacterium]